MRISLKLRDTHGLYAGHNAWWPAGSILSLDFVSNLYMRNGDTISLTDVSGYGDGVYGYGEYSYGATGSDSLASLITSAMTGRVEFTAPSSAMHLAEVIKDSNNRCILEVDGSSNLIWSYISSGTTVASLTLGSVTPSSDYEAAWSAEASDFQAIMTGGTRQTDASGAAFSSPTEAYVGMEPNGTTIKELTLWPTAQGASIEDLV